MLWGIPVRTTKVIRDSRQFGCSGFLNRAHTRGFDYGWDDSHGFLIRIEHDHLVTLRAWDGNYEDWAYNGELSAEVETIFGENIWVTTSTTLARPPWRGPIFVRATSGATLNDTQGYPSTTR